MTSPILKVPIVFFIFTALILSILTSISVPIIHVLPIAKTDFSNLNDFVMIPTNNGGNTITVPLQELRFGLWGICYYYLEDEDENESVTCVHGTLANPYTGTLMDSNDTLMMALPQTVITHGLAFEPVGTVMILFLFLSSLFIRKGRETWVAISSWISIVAAILTLATLGLNVALLVKVRNALNSVTAPTTPGISIWLNVATFILILLATTGLFFGARGDGGEKRRVTVIEDSGKTPLSTMFKGMK